MKIRLSPIRMATLFKIVRMGENYFTFTIAMVLSTLSALSADTA